MKPTMSQMESSKLNKPPFPETRNQENNKINSDAKMIAREKDLPLCRYDPPAP
jgi:hypothetical protein